MTEPDTHDTPDADILAAYRARKLRHDRIRIAKALFFALFVLLLAVLRNAQPWAGIIAVVAVVGFLVLTLVDLSTWNCPQCGRAFGREHDPKFCSHCGAKLQR